MKVRYVFAVAAVSALTLFGAAGTSSAATSHPAPRPAAHACGAAVGTVVTAGSVTGSPVVGSVAPAKAALKPALKPALKAVPAGKTVAVCSGHATIPTTGPVATPSHGITLSTIPAQATAPATK